ncbi:MAG TPA: YHS domain protein [Desulfobulbaceae bacterium]|nr:YHS domain protein [Desulfobulbaceae bacterium]
MKRVLNADPFGKIALQGYDPVAFHAAGKPMKGNPAILTEYGGYKFVFASEENKTAFEKEPEKYLPAFGGYCAFGVSIGVLFPVEIDTWEIIDGHLVLQYTTEVKQMFEKDKSKNLRKAAENWVKMESEMAR